MYEAFSWIALGELFVGVMTGWMFNMIPR